MAKPANGIPPARPEENSFAFAFGMKSREGEEVNATFNSLPRNRAWAMANFAIGVAKNDQKTIRHALRMIGIDLAD